ncbi:MAG: cob(I)yrinic acid a,c-diamide adenosyltransferase [Planctomycetaceae bacterium]|nr:MAG: cob(I)yrinic acid a,c-diamide adenosyltransferase [Planctomycetaceae bacterium]
MVYLHRIYTRSGDTGETSLGDGSRVPKTHPRIAAYGGVDELNSVLGMVLTHEMSDAWRQLLRSLQNDLFDLGADLCLPLSAETSPTQPCLRITEGHVTRLEQLIDEFNSRLSPLTSFVLPGGTPLASALHWARTVCRRVELMILHLAAREPVNPQASIYINRLSDLLFVMARAANDEGRADILWQPGGTQQS